MMSKLSILMMMFSVPLLSTNVTYFLSLLILFEFIVVCLIALIFNNMVGMEAQFLVMFLLVISIAESVLGLTLLVIMVKCHGHENITMLFLLSW
nr:NADH dehydrogenase subunit 4L [Dielis tejensis]